MPTVIQNYQRDGLPIKLPSQETRSGIRRGGIGSHRLPKICILFLEDVFVKIVNLYKTAIYTELNFTQSPNLILFINYDWSFGQNSSSLFFFSTSSGFGWNC